MSTTVVGRAAEAVACDYLQNRGYRTLARNWRTRWCEIDLVMCKVTTVYFVEVKYRASGRWGTGLDYITPQKLQQLQFAAQFWMARHPGTYTTSLLGIACSGDPPQVTDCVDLM